eukprot:TRINITY_DN16811_c0_g2_i1.p1 TRINITY_DN16811_c0_g2~~TRINITY_DN16811_c0_g2_i1.p1  ORF type:complete len:106 (-),score=41.56 TRINITY_DN16811_c0_g2_i1:85-402(-)
MCFRHDGYEGDLYFCVVTEKDKKMNRNKVDFNGWAYGTEKYVEWHCEEALEKLGVASWGKKKFLSVVFRKLLDKLPLYDLFSVSSDQLKENRKEFLNYLVGGIRD